MMMMLMLYLSLNKAKGHTYITTAIEKLSGSINSKGHILTLFS